MRTIRTRTFGSLSPQCLDLLVATLTAFLATAGSCADRLADKQYDAGALKVDGRYVQEIRFSALALPVLLRPNAYVRVDAPVRDTTNHLRLLLREFGVTTTNIAYTNPAKFGGQLHLRFRDGRECSFLWVCRDADSRVTRARLEHEKYHALCRLAPEAIGSVSRRTSELGFRLNLSSYDEEFAALLVEVLTLHLERIAWKDIHGSDPVEKAVQLLRDCEAEPNPRKTSAPAEDWRILVQWPHGREVIEIPLEFLDCIPVVRCRLNGKEALLYVDTACQPICLYADRLPRFGITAAGEVDSPRYTALGHTDKTSLTGKYLLTFDDGLSMAVSCGVSLPREGRDPNDDVDGILGVRVMKALNAVVDLGASKLIFSPEKHPKAEQRTGSAVQDREPIHETRKLKNP